MPAEAALARIKNGDRVMVSHAVGEPSYLLDVLVDHAADYENVDIVHMVCMGKGAYAQPGMEKHFHHTGLFLGGPTRECVASGRGDFLPCYFSEAPALMRTELRPDVALLQVTPPDEHGMCSLGVSVDYTMESVKQAGTVIAQVNDRMPWTFGGSTVHVSEIDCFVPFSAPILELGIPKIGPIEEAIGANCAALVKDGDTLQLGIGAIPDAVLLGLKDKHDLGIHSEMVSDGAVELMEAGVINNSRKNIHRGKSVATFLMGTQRLYSFVDNNPDVELYPVDYVNDPRVIAQNDNVVSINSAVQVDFMGQVCAEAIGSRQISGVGGQVDFIRGAAMSRGGRAIIAMPSTTKGISKIVPALAAGTPVTTSRNDVDYVVTEYGVAHLKGHSLRERARALIAIAHPDHRDDLKAAFEEQFHSRY